MAGDLQITERAVIEGGGELRAAERGVGTEERPIHHYGRVAILGGPDVTGAEAAPQEREFRDALGDLTEVERLGLAGLRLRESAEYRQEKDSRPRNGEPWNMEACTTVVSTPREAAPRVGARAAGPTSSYLEGSVAVGIIVVQGPTAALKFSDAELVKVVAEVQNGLGWLATVNPLAGISFSYDIQNVNVAVQPDPNAADLEALWRDPAMAALGFSGDWNGVVSYVEDIRTRFGTRWTYCGFFTKYPLGHFAYASIGGPRLVMDYNNDGWGPDNIDRVFAHESGHIFGCPDEYAASGCSCGGSWGRFGLANGNCENCAGETGIPCLMKMNTFEACNHTPGHLGWAPQLVVRNFGYDAGGWRVDKHPRLLADTTGDRRADIVGFGDAGVWVSRAQAGGRYETPQLVVDNFGYNAGGWRVDKHPRLLADTSGDGRADIVGFGDAGVYVSLAQPDGSFGPVTRVVDNFGYDAGGWRVDKHPRLLADTTGDGRADIVGFGDAGVYVSQAKPDGSFGPVTRVVDNFGYDAGGWRVDKHPRFVGRHHRRWPRRHRRIRRRRSLCVSGPIGRQLRPGHARGRQLRLRRRRVARRQAPTLRRRYHRRWPRRHRRIRRRRGVCVARPAGRQLRPGHARGRQLRLRRRRLARRAASPVPGRYDRRRSARHCRIRKRGRLGLACSGRRWL